MVNKLKLQHFVKDSSIVHTLYIALLLRHDALFKIVKTKKQMREQIEAQDCKLAIVVNENAIGTIVPSGYSRYRNKSWRIRTFSDGKRTYDDTGGITRMIQKLPVGTYYVYDNSDNKLFWASSKSSSEYENLELEDIVDLIYSRVHTLAKKALEDRLFYLREKLATFSDPNNNFDLGPEMIDHEHYQNENCFEQVTKNFEKVAKLYNNSEHFENHIRLTIKSLTTKNYSDWTRRSYTVGKFKSIDYSTNPWGENWTNTGFGNNRYRNIIYKRINCYLEHGDITKRDLINEISLEVIWFYRNLIHKESEVRYWKPTVFPYEFL